MPTILTLDEAVALATEEKQNGGGKTHESTTERTKNLRLIVDGTAVSFFVACDEESGFTRDKSAPKPTALAAAYNRIVKANKWEKDIVVTPLKVKGGILVAKK